MTAMEPGIGIGARQIHPVSPQIRLLAPLRRGDRRTFNQYTADGLTGQLSVIR